MIFFLDENLHGNIVPGILEAAGLHVEQHKKHFEQGVDDEIWIPEVARRGWIAVTCDVNTRFTKDQVRAIIRSKAQVIHMMVVGQPRMLGTNKGLQPLVPKYPLFTHLNDTAFGIEPPPI